MENRKLKQLLKKHRNGTLSSDEKAMLESWYIHFAVNSTSEVSNEILDKNLELIAKGLPLKHQPVIIRPMWPRIAAAMLIFISLGVGYLLYNQQQSAVNNMIAKNDAAPGKNQATLTLASGKKVILSNVINGQLANTGGVTIVKAKNGELIYTVHDSKNKPGNEIQFNTLATANGEQYHVILPDGSNVWLNASSSLKYPVFFTGSERVVELIGEAYFEVAHNKNMPFKVKTGTQEVQVLGTHFNISSYDGEKTTTTLLEGSVKVTSKATNRHVLITPGQQTILDNAGLNVQEADTDEAVAWKNGYFDFNGESLESIMHKVARWYNVDVEYKDNTLRSVVFSGTVSKYKNVSEVIKVLELTNAAHFNIDNNKIIVTN